MFSDQTHVFNSDVYIPRGFIHLELAKRAFVTPQEVFTGGVDKRVGKLPEEVVLRVVGYKHPLPHGQRFSGGGGNHIGQRCVHQHLPWPRYKGDKWSLVSQTKSIPH